MSTPSTPATPSTSPPERAEAAPMEPGYGANQIAFAAFLATPVAGAVLAALNFTRQGRVAAARIVVALAAVVVAVVVALDFVGFGALTLWVSPIWALVAGVLASVAFPKENAQRSWRGVAFAIGGVWLAFSVIAAGVAGVLHLRGLSAQEISADAVVHADFEVVQYQDGATRTDAEDIERALTQTGYFDGTKRLRVVVDVPEHPGHRVRLTVLAMPPLAQRDVDAARSMVHAVAKNLGHCVIGRLVAPTGDVLTGGTACP
jgi:hypothetical protein